MDSLRALSGNAHGCYDSARSSRGEWIDHRESIGERCRRAAREKFDPVIGVRLMGGSRILFVDAGAGASGDMILGALLDLGVPVERIRAAVASLPLKGFRLSERRVRREGIAARQVTVEVKARQPERGWRDIQRILNGGSLDPHIRNRALAVFRRLIDAEAEVHSLPPARVHLHEVGAVDAIVDVVGACAGIAHLAPDRIVVSRLTTGFGSVACEHGLYPVPAPATALLIRGAPVVGGSIEGERLTPTGAAILTTLADAWGPLPPMRPASIGYGSGTRVFPGTANVLRMVIGEEDTDSASRVSEGEVIVIEATMDDCPPQTLAFAAERLFEAGALDVFVTSLQMKKGRSGHALTILSRDEEFDALVKLVFHETTTLGLRFRREKRLELARRVDTVRTPLGALRVKVGLLDGTPIQSWPEYEDCAIAARKHGVSLKKVQRAVLQAHRDSSGSAPLDTRSAGKRSPRRSLHR